MEMNGFGGMFQKIFFYNEKYHEKTRYHSALNTPENHFTSVKKNG